MKDLVKKTLIFLFLLAASGLSYAHAEPCFMTLDDVKQVMIMNFKMGYAYARENNTIKRSIQELDKAGEKSANDIIGIIKALQIMEQNQKKKEGPKM